MLSHIIYNIIIFQERLGESPGNCKELMSSSNDESVSDGDEPQQTEQEEDVKDAH